MVYATTEFLYGNAMRTDAVVIGPKQDDNLPPGMVMRNSGVFGVHPYRGGNLACTIVLSRMPRNDAARGLLDVIQSVGSALDPGTGLATWTKLGGVVLDGFERLVGLDGVQPLLGARVERDPDRNDQIRPGYTVLIDQAGIEPKRLWVADGELLYGPDPANARPYRDSDYVLYELIAAPGGERRDIDRLPFQPLWNAALEAAGKSSGSAWDEAKANLAALASAIDRSPDLTRAQGNRLIERYIADLVLVHQRAVKLSHLAAAAETTAVQRQISDILALR